MAEPIEGEQTVTVSFCGTQLTITGTDRNVKKACQSLGLADPRAEPDPIPEPIEPVPPRQKYGKKAHKN